MLKKIILTMSLALGVTAPLALSNAQPASAIYGCSTQFWSSINGGASHCTSLPSGVKQKVRVTCSLPGSYGIYRYGGAAGNGQWSHASCPSGYTPTQVGIVWV